MGVGSLDGSLMEVEEGEGEVFIHLFFLTLRSFSGRPRSSARGSRGYCKILAVKSIRIHPGLMVFLSLKLIVLDPTDLESLLFQTKTRYGTVISWFQS